jgi:hypothetical protein
MANITACTASDTTADIATRTAAPTRRLQPDQLAGERA